MRILACAINLFAYNTHSHYFGAFKKRKSLGYSQVVKAPVFDTGIRKFESCYPSQFFRNIKSKYR